MLLALTAGAAAQTASPNPLPEPYSADEFPDWAVSLRRWEIISLGAFPIVLFYTKFVFDFTRYAGSGFNAYYAPWPFKNEYTYKPTNGEQAVMFLTAAGLSAAFGILDAVLLASDGGS